MENEKIYYWDKLELSSLKDAEDAYDEYCIDMATALDGDIYPWTRY